jgi:hypothetical protein
MKARIIRFKFFYGGELIATIPARRLREATMLLRKRFPDHKPETHIYYVEFDPIGSYFVKYTIAGDYPRTSKRFATASQAETELARIRLLPNIVMAEVKPSWEQPE